MLPGRSPDTSAAAGGRGVTVPLGSAAQASFFTMTVAYLVLSAVPIRKGNLSQFPQSELSPAEPALALALALAPPSSQAPMEAQAFDPSLRVPVRMENLSQFPQPELPLAEPAQAPAQALAPAPALVLSSSQTPKQAQAFDPSFRVPVRMENPSQFPQPKLPLAEPTQALAPALAPPSSQAPKQAQAFDPSFCVPIRMENLRQFPQPKLPLAKPAQASALASAPAPAPAPVLSSSQTPKQAQAFDPSLHKSC
ncbi:hypothetical protein NL676_005481 [Syzygium grande]|nr:hypothetical protein NL676_005481 [Syzygium grande]